MSLALHINSEMRYLCTGHVQYFSFFLSVAEMVNDAAEVEENETAEWSPGAARPLATNGHAAKRTRADTPGKYENRKRCRWFSSVNGTLTTEQSKIILNPRSWSHNYTQYFCRSVQYMMLQLCLSTWRYFGKARVHEYRMQLLPHLSEVKTFLKFICLTLPIASLPQSGTRPLYCDPVV